MAIWGNIPQTQNVKGQMARRMATKFQIDVPLGHDPLLWNPADRSLAQRGTADRESRGARRKNAKRI